MDNLKGYFFIYSQPYKNISKHRQITNIFFIYQTLDIIITIVDASSFNIMGERVILIARIITQIVLLIIFGLFFNYLRQFKNQFLNVATLSYFISLKICWTETDYYLASIDYKSYSSYIAEIYIMLAGLVMLQESYVCQTLTLLFSLFYSIFRTHSFESKLDILSSIRIILIHSSFQLYFIFEPKVQQKLNDSLIIRGSLAKFYVPMSSHRTQMQQHRLSTIINGQENEIKLRLQSQIKENDQILQDDNRLDTDRQHLDQFYENVLNNIQIGVFVVDNLQSQVKAINPYMSHIVLKEDCLSDEFLNTELFDFGIGFEEENLTVLPKFNRSKDIGNFIKFMHTLKI